MFVMPDEGSLWSWGYNLCILYTSWLIFETFLAANLLVGMPVIVWYLGCHFLDYLTDGQLGYGDQNSLFPCLVDQFQDLDPPETLDDEAQSTRVRTSLKV